MSGRILFYVQHLLGIGHVQRASVVVRSMVAAGLDVHVAFGGVKVPGIDFGGADVRYLPAIRAADKSFEAMVDEKGRHIDDAGEVRRRQALLGLYREIRPDVLVIELFPFGRRYFRFELIPLLEAAHAAVPRPLVACSVRDVLVQKPRPERNREMVDWARQWFDRILVHGDPKLIRFEETFPDALAIRKLLRYTGYVVQRERAPSPDDSGAIAGTDEVIVSVGGGAVGETLLRTALAARPLCRASDAVWRLLGGPYLPRETERELKEPAGDGIVFEDARRDFPDLLRNCAVSISQGGYNTVVEVLQARARAVIVPFGAGDEDEQAYRAGVLADRGLVSVVTETELSAERLAAAVDAAVAAPRPSPTAIDMDGAETTARIIGELAGR